MHAHPLASGARPCSAAPASSRLMVGVLIGMIVVAVVYNVLVMAEGYKRSTIGVADAQVTGQLAQFVVGREARQRRRRDDDRRRRAGAAAPTGG